MYEHGKSDKPIVPKKSANKGVPATRAEPAESMEGRGLAKGNSGRQTRLRTLSRIGPATSAGLRYETSPHSDEHSDATAAARHDPRQEPSAVIPHAGICGGGPGQPGSLLRPLIRDRSRYPGRKPWAVIFSPFRATNTTAGELRRCNRLKRYMRPSGENPQARSPGEDSPARSLIR